MYQSLILYLSHVSGTKLQAAQDVIACIDGQPEPCRVCLSLVTSPSPPGRSQAHVALPHPPTTHPPTTHPPTTHPPTTHPPTTHPPTTHPPTTHPPTTYHFAAHAPERLGGEGLLTRLSVLRWWLCWFRVQELLLYQLTLNSSYRVACETHPALVSVLLTSFHH